MTDLQAPQSATGNYTKLQPGENRLRIISDVLAGWECWTESNGSRKPIRQEEQWKAKELTDMGIEDKVQKQFYMAIVWNYGTQQFECMLQTQKSIKEGIFLLLKDEDWGDLKNYDIVINKSGSGMETKYSVNPKPHSEFDKEIPSYDLHQMYEGGNPFDDSKQEHQSEDPKNEEKTDVPF